MEEEEGLGVKGNNYGEVSVRDSATVTRGWVTADVGPTQHGWLLYVFPVSSGFLRANDDDEEEEDVCGV